MPPKPYYSRNNTDLPTNNSNLNSPNINNKQAQKLVANLFQGAKNDQINTVQSRPASYKQMLPNKISMLSNSVFFQGLDNLPRSKKNIQAPKTIEPKPAENTTNSSSNINPIGLIANVYMNTTTKFVKTDMSQKSDSPFINMMKNMDSQRKASSSITNTPKKFERLKFTQDQSADLKIQPITLILNNNEDTQSNYSAQHGVSNNPKRIQRKYERHSRQLKFTDKKNVQQKQGQVSERQILSVKKPEESVIVQNVNSLPNDSKLKKTSFIRAQRPSFPSRNQQTPTIEKKTSQIEQKAEILTKNQAKVQSPTSSPAQLSKITPKPNIISQSTPRTPTQVIKSNYSNNSNSKIQQSRTKQLEKNKESIVHSTIPQTKSNSLFFIVKRLYLKAQRNCLKKIKQYSQNIQRKYKKQSAILASAAKTIFSQKIKNLLLGSFQTLKRKFSSVYIQQIKNKLENFSSKEKNILPVCLNKLYLTKLKKSFSNLKYKNQSKIHIPELVNLQLIFKTKNNHLKKIAFTTIINFSRYKNRLLNKFITLINKSHLQTLKQSFFSILILQRNKVTNTDNNQSSRVSVKPQQPKHIPQKTTQNSINQAKIKELKKANQILAEQINKLSINVSQSQKNLNTNKKDMANLIKQMSENIKSIRTQIQDKKARQNQLKDIIQKSVVSESQMKINDEFQSQSEVFEMLTNVYINHYKPTQQQLSIQQIIQNYQVSIEDDNNSIRQWNLLMKNQELKSLISAYEGQVAVRSNIKDSLMSEQGMIKKLIKSFVRQQYFWNWLHISTQNL